MVRSSDPRTRIKDSSLTTVGVLGHVKHQLVASLSSRIVSRQLHCIMVLDTPTLKLVVI